MTRTIYVVSERSFEYNDEYYHLPYDGSGEKSGQAKLAFSDKDQALSIRDQKNIEWLKGNDLGQYGEEGLRSLSYKNSSKLEKLFELLKISHENYEIIVPHTISNEQAQEIVKLIDIAPWIVSEVVYKE